MADWGGQNLEAFNPGDLGVNVRSGCRGTSRMTTTVQAPYGARRFQLSRVAELTLDMLRRDFAVSYGLAVAIVIVPSLLSTILLKTRVQGVVGAAPGHLPTAFGPTIIFTSLLGLLASLLAYGALSWRAVERLQGRDVSVGSTLEAGFRALPVLIAVAILGYIGIVLASLLLVVPGLILATMWIVVLPTATCEKTGVFRSFGRSAELTKGHRWLLFGLMIVTWLGALIVTVLGALLIRAMLGISGNIFLVQPTGPMAYVATLLQILLGSLVRIVFAVGLGVVFQELRADKGGFDGQRLSDVFA